MRPRTPKRLRPPLRGVSNASAFEDNPMDFCPLAAERNVFLFDAFADRPRFGRRPGLEKAFGVQLGSENARRGQGLGVISRASGVSGYTAGALSSLAGTSRSATAPSGNTWAVRASSLALWFDADQSNGVPFAGVPVGQAASMMALHPSGKFYAVAYVYTDGHVRAALVLYRASDGQQLTTFNLSITSGGQYRRPLAMCFTGGGLFFTFDAFTVTVGGNQVNTILGYLALAATFDGAGEVLTAALSGPTGTTCYIDQAFPLNNTTPGGLPATNAQTQANAGYNPLGKGRALGYYKHAATGQEYVYVAYDGTGWSVMFIGTSARPGTGLSAAVQAACRYLRAGVARVMVPTSLAGGPALTWDNMSALGAAAGLYDEERGGTPVNHRSFRFSAQLRRRVPRIRGASPSALVVDPRDGSFIVAYSNQGHGYQLDGSAVALTPNAGVEYTSLAKVSFSGSLSWEADAESVIGDEAGGKLAGVGGTYPTDAPDQDGANAGTTSRDGPAIRALAVDPQGDVYAAGRINAGGFSVFKFSGTNGAQRWRRKVSGGSPGAAGDGVAAGAIAVDPRDGAVVVGMKQNFGWATPPRRAHLLKLAAADGAVLRSADLGATGADVTCLAAFAGGVAYGTNHV